MEDFHQISRLLRKTWSFFKLSILETIFDVVIQVNGMWC